MIDSRNFYQALPIRHAFRDVVDPDVYRPVPSDWHVVHTDIRDSTTAIESGKYKEVNLIGAACIAAVLNVAGETDLPFTFGGDGATLLVPHHLLPEVRGALAGVRTSARDGFSLDLRVGIVPVRDLHEDGAALRVARFRVTDEYAQAVFMGGGVRRVDEWIKSDAGSRYLLPTDQKGGADYSGLECRWQDVPSRHGETVTLIVTAAGASHDAAQAAYRRAIDAVAEIYGDEADHRPLIRKALRESYSWERLQYEARLRAPGAGLRRSLYALRIGLQNGLLRAFLHFDVTTGTTHWRGYLDRLVQSVDFRKVDDALRMVIVGTPDQRRRLQTVLRDESRRGTLAYGMSVSDRAHLTCLVFARMGRQVHFLDGADGGYALAARNLKRQLAERRQ